MAVDPLDASHRALIEQYVNVDAPEEEHSNALNQLLICLWLARIARINYVLLN